MYSRLRRRTASIIERGRDAGNAAVYSAGGVAGVGGLAWILDHFHFIRL